MNLNGLYNTLDRHEKNAKLGLIIGPSKLWAWMTLAQKVSIGLFRLTLRELLLCSSSRRDLRDKGKGEIEIGMGAITTAVIAIGAVVLGWITIEIACKPCLEKGREAIDRSLNPDYDPDDEISDIRAPLNSNPDFTPDLVHTNPTHPSSTTSDVIKAV